MSSALSLTIHLCVSYDLIDPEVPMLTNFFFKNFSNVSVEQNGFTYSIKNDGFKNVVLTIQLCAACDQIDQAAGAPSVINLFIFSKKY